jgi:small membrane protein
MSQPIIKLLLLAAIALVALFALRGSTKAVHRILWRAYVVGILLAAAASVLFPGILVWLAKLVGVGRGTDLLLYILVITFLFVSVILFRRLDALERRYVGLARAVAIQQASTDSPIQPAASHADPSGDA